MGENTNHRTCSSITTQLYPQKPDKPGALRHWWFSPPNIFTFPAFPKRHLQGAGVRSTGADVQRRAHCHRARVGATGAAAEAQLAVLKGPRFRHLEMGKSMKIWYFYIVTPPKSSSFDHGFPTENRYFTCCSQFSHPTGKFGREPGSGDKPDTDQISNILVRHVPNKQQGIRPKCRFHQQIKRGTLWVANSCS